MGLADLFQESSFLNDIGDGFHLYTFRLVDVLESVRDLGALVLHDAHLTSNGLARRGHAQRRRAYLAKGALADHPQEVKVLDG